MIRVTVWNEFYHEGIGQKPGALQCYPEGIHKYLEGFLQEEFQVRTATLYNADGHVNENAGITRELLDETDVMLWWAHVRHGEVPDAAANMVAQAVRQGMGIVFLHSAHLSKPFRFLMGTSGTLIWRESGDKERLWTINPAHPIARGIPAYVTLPHEEMYGEPFGIPEPDQLVFIGSFEPGEVFRSGCCWQRNCGKVFYFQPGHETFPTYHIPEIQQIIKNAVRWAYSDYRVSELSCPGVKKPQD